MQLLLLFDFLFVLPVIYSQPLFYWKTIANNGTSNYRSQCNENNVVGLPCCNSALPNDVFVHMSAFGDIDHINGSISLLLDDMKGKRFSLVGDSLMRQTFEAFRYSLQLNNIPNTETSTHYKYDIAYETFYIMNNSLCWNDNTQQYCGDSLSDRNLSCDCLRTKTIEIPQYKIFVTAANQHQWEIVGDTNPKHRPNGICLKCMYSLLFEHLLKTTDTMIVNLGLHYHFSMGHCEQFKFIIDYTTHILQRDMLLDKKKKKQHYYRGTFPVHFHGPDGSYEKRNNLLLGSCDNISKFPRPNTEIAAAAMINGKIPVISMYRLLSNRSLFHSGGKDCTHWCFKYELWYPILSMTFLRYYRSEKGKRLQDSNANIGDLFNIKSSTACSKKIIMNILPYENIVLTF